MPKIMVEPHSRKSIELFANKLKIKLELDNKLYIPIMKVVELIIPQIDYSFNCYPVENKQMPREYAKYIPSTNELLIREDVYEAACNDDGRHRFTIAHELGHYFLHDNVSLARCPDSFYIPAYRDPEWQANVFASSFLINPELIKGMSADEIANKCKTSYQAAAIALKYVI